MALSMRIGKDLIDATRPFAREDRARSWFHTASTLGMLAASIAIAARTPWWPLRLAGAALESMLLVRAFILYHDYMHGALLRGSRLASILFHAQGVLLLNPPAVWADTHNYHHAHTAKLLAHSKGTFELWTVDRWRAASGWQRFLYRFERHPITLLLGYGTVFFAGMCVMPFVQNPKRYASSGLAVVLHVAISIATWRVFGPAVYVTAIAAPLLVACALGAYLFYAQHNYPGMVVSPEDEWNYAQSSIEGSSYLATGRVMEFFTGNIGYHHVHHLNARIPFYRLPEAMAAIPELQNPGVTTLRPRDVLDCLRLDLWDPAQRRMVRFADVEQSVGDMLAGQLTA